MISVSLVLTGITAGLLYVFPKAKFEILPRKVNVVLEGGILVNAICRRKYGSQDGNEDNIMFDILGAITSAASTFVVGYQQTRIVP